MFKQNKKFSETEFHAYSIEIGSKVFIVDSHGIYEPHEYMPIKHDWCLRGAIVCEIIDNIDKYFKTTKAFNKSGTSYGHKHAIEKKLSSKYCSNGEFILAAYKAGKKIKYIDSINCLMNIKPISNTY